MNHQADFAERIARIHASRAPVSAARKECADKAPGLGATVLFVAVLGPLAYLISLYVRFRLVESGGPVFDPQMEILFSVGMAMAIGLLASLLAGVHSFGVFLLLPMSVGAAVFLTQDIVKIFPEPFAQVYSPSWVDLMLGQSETAAILFQGTIFNL